MVVSKRWFEFSGGTEFRYPLFYLNLTSFLPQFYLFFNLFFLFFNLCFIANLEPRFGNHGLQTLGTIPPEHLLCNVAATGLSLLAESMQRNLLCETIVL